MSETTIIPPAGSTTPGFHAHEGGHHNGHDFLLLHQQLANEGRINQKSVYDVALSSKDSVERSLISQKSDSERLQIRIAEAHLEAVKQADTTRIELARNFDILRRDIEETKRMVLTLDKERADRALAEAMAEVRFLRANPTAA